MQLGPQNLRAKRPSLFQRLPSGVVLAVVRAGQAQLIQVKTTLRRITAGGFAASVVGTVWEQNATMHQSRLAEVMGANDPAFTGALQKLQGAGLGATQAVGAVTNQVISQAYLLSTDDIFRVAAFLMVLLIPCVWLTRKALGAGASHAAAD